MIAAVEGIEFRHKIYFSEKFYYLEIVNITKLNLINSWINHGAIDTKTFNALFHDVFGLLISGICIAFISTCLPLTNLLFEVNEEDKKLKIFLVSRIISFIGVLLILIAAILYVTKYTSIVNLDYTPGCQIEYKTTSQLFDMGAYAGLMIMVIMSRLILFVTPKKLK